MRATQDCQSQWFPCVLCCPVSTIPLLQCVGGFVVGSGGCHPIRFLPSQWQRDRDKFHNTKDFYHLPFCPLFLPLSLVFYSHAHPKEIDRETMLAQPCDTGRLVNPQLVDGCDETMPEIRPGPSLTARRISFCCVARRRCE